MNNAVMLWALLNGLVGFLLFYLGYRFPGKRTGARPDMWGARVGVAELARTCALAAVLFLAYLRSALHAVRVPPRRLPVPVHGRARLPAGHARCCWRMYAPFFLLFFLSNSLRVNGVMRVEGEAEWKSLLLAGIANSAGLLLIVIVQYATMAATGTVYWTEGWLYVNLLFAVVPMMFVLPYFNRYFFRMTGQDLSGPADDLPHLRDDPALEHRLLPAAVTGTPSPPVRPDSGLGVWQGLR